MPSFAEFSLAVFEGIAEGLSGKDCVSLSSSNKLLRSFLPLLRIKVKVWGDSIEEGVRTEERGTFRVGQIVCKMREEDARLASLVHLESATLLLEGGSFSPSLLTPLSSLTRLREVLLCNARLETLSPLSSCPSLETLTLYYVFVSEKESFSSLNLKSLFITSISLGDVAPFLYPIDLDRLEIRSEREFAFPPPLCSLDVERLDIPDTKLSLLPSLSSPFPSIKSLTLFRCGEESLSCLSSLLLLQDLHLLGCQKLKSIHFVSTMRKLETLSVTYSSVRDVSPLSSVPSVQTLSLEGTNANSFSPIKHLTGLRELDLSHTIVEDISFLKYAPFLTSVRLFHTILQDPSPLFDLPFITMVKFSY